MFVLELSGLAVPGPEEHLRRVGSVLAAHPGIAPTCVGPKDPPRSVVTDLVTDLTLLGREQSGSARAVAHLASPDRGDTATVSYVADPFSGHPPGFVRPSRVELTMVAPDPTRLGVLLAELAVATRAFYGFVSTRSHLAQLRGAFTADRRRRHGPSPSGGAPPSWQPPAFQALEMALPDVFWLQYLGPAFVSRWGDERVAAAGVGAERVNTGGYLVSTGVAPPPFDEAAQHPEDYHWKASVYDALGPEPFVRADRAWNAFGAHVPLLTEHRPDPDPGAAQA